MKLGFTSKLFLWSVMITALIPGLAIGAQVTLIGEVIDDYQLVADEQVYEIADTAEGNDLAENYINAKVKIIGTVEDDDIKMIKVISFEVITEQ